MQFKIWKVLGTVSLLTVSSAVYSHNDDDIAALKKKHESDLVEIQSRIAKLENRMDNLKEGGATTNMPSGSLLILSKTANGCPAGWREFEEAYGRYLVGASEREFVGIDVGQALKDEENRPAGEHSHKYKDVAVNGGGKKTRNSGYRDFKVTERTTLEGDLVDGTNAPYRTVFYCEKI